MPLTRRKFIISTAATGAALTTVVPSAAALAQDKPTVGVGSKDFTESIILAHICGDLLEDAGYGVDRQINLGGTVVAHEATVNGDIDLYVEYTGTGLLAILGMELPEMDRDAEASASPAAGAGKDPVYDVVAEASPGQFGLEWLEPWGFNNTYVMAVRRETADELGITTISDLEGHAGDMIVGGTQEFLIRP